MAFPYVVQQGDTWLRIAARYGIHASSLHMANPQIQEAPYLIAGQVIYIPYRPDHVYMIQEGDTFYEIARRFNVPIQILLNANPSVDPRSLKIAQSLVIPLTTSGEIVRTDAEYGPVQLMEDAERLCERYPFIRQYIIGYSVMGKPIIALRIGTGEREIHFNGAVHANEWITSPILMKYMEQYAKAYRSGTSWNGMDPQDCYNCNSLWVVPMVNPDGVELAQEGISPRHPYYRLLLQWNGGSFQFARWKANIRGVDLNDQFPAHWEEERERRGKKGPGPRDYSSEAPLTEPEAATLAEFTRAHNFDMVVSLHSQGEEIYWNYRDYEPSVSEEIARRFAQASGYRSVKLSGSDAGYKDWFIQEFRKPGFTIEVGQGRNPLPLQDFREIYQDVAGLLTEALRS
ncbi:peptidase M14 [Paenibacillus selenitireducens]|uniref:Peptidase M14 n=1 Tax=Paenibacillus selenitireducens TaxID=1324314 RepID=A0A1T2XMI7_9BACL|nr:M14 family zinc carboxypeptidase [Paenibacillus selenitireducens]OPA81090.1 peptidase M14 [Paenibacillus selenitireducens]